MTESLATEIALFALTGLAFNLLVGYTGLLSFGHGLFFGFAAYAAALSSKSSGDCTTCTIGSPYAVAKSQSRWSCAGTAMIAPVP